MESRTPDGLNGSAHAIQRTLGRLEGTLEAIQRDMRHVTEQLDHLEERVREVEIRAAIIAATTGAIAAFIAWQIQSQLA